jgi:uncharacterized membrane protein
VTLVQEWKQAWRWFSMQAMAATVAVQMVWAGLPDDLKRHLPEKLVAALSLGLLLVGIMGRLVRQKNMTSEKKS